MEIRQRNLSKVMVAMAMSRAVIAAWVRGMWNGTVSRALADGKFFNTVIPAQAGSQLKMNSFFHWAPACTGVTSLSSMPFKRNIDCFPADFMFRLSREEVEALNRSQIATGSQKHRDPRFPPYAFTEYGPAI